METFTNQLELRLIGMSRSGNHALVDWILAQVAGRYCFLNCAEPKHNPFLAARELEDGRSYRVNYPEFTLASEGQGDLSTKDLLIHSYEDVYLGAVAHASAERQRDAWLGRAERRCDVLLLRDPFNLFASRIRSGLYDNRYIWGEKVVSMGMGMRIWKQHAREFLGERNMLPRPKVFVNFNEWSRSRAYRKKLAAALGLQLRQHAAPRVAAVAGGSSFEGLRQDGQADRMALHHRWKSYIDEPRYLALFDEEALKLSDAIFGALPAAEEIRARRSATL